MQYGKRMTDEIIENPPNKRKVSGLLPVQSVYRRLVRNVSGMRFL